MFGGDTMKKSYFPVSTEWVYLHLYGGLYNGSGADADKMKQSEAIAEILNASYSVGEDNGKAGRNQGKKYVAKCAAEIVKHDPKIIKNRKFYKVLLDAIKNSYDYGFQIGSQEGEKI